LLTLKELSIKVNIADRYYPLKVTPEQEEIVRQAAKLINDKLKALQQEFDVKDKQDMLSMTVLELASQLITLQNKNVIEDDGLTAQLQELRILLKDISL
jgi:cell division protein ZapA (FtsZ GTPase activity inhibitor)